jgi:hypothetical protein
MLKPSHVVHNNRLALQSLLDIASPCAAQLDIEGYEWDFLGALGTEVDGDSGAGAWQSALPEQLAVQVGEGWSSTAVASRCGSGIAV